MATVLEEYTTEEQRSVVRFWKKWPYAKYIDKERFPVYGKYLSRKALHNWVEKFSQGRSKVADDARLSAEVAETTVKRLLCCGFRRTGKAIGQVYQCRWRICPKINVFSLGSNIACFTFCIHLWPIYCLSLILQLSQTVSFQNTFEFITHLSYYYSRCHKI
jgi:hypothetical protein